MQNSVTPAPNSHNPQAATPRGRRALKVIALFEGVKGVAAIAASFGLLELVHHDTRHLAMALIGHFGLDPGAHYPTLLLHYADALQDANIRNIVLLAWAYAAIRVVEGYGLWLDRAWAEWLAALSGALYIPFEFEHLLHKTNFINGAVLLANIGTVAFMVWRLWQRERSRRAYVLAPGAK